MVETQYVTDGHRLADRRWRVWLDLEDDRVAVIYNYLHFILFFCLLSVLISSSPSRFRTGILVIHHHHHQPIAVHCWT